MRRERLRVKKQLISTSSGNSFVSVIKDFCDNRDNNSVRKLEMTSIFTWKFALPPKKELYSFCYSENVKDRNPKADNKLRNL